MYLHLIRWLYIWCITVAFQHKQGKSSLTWRGNIKVRPSIVSSQQFSTFIQRHEENIYDFLTWFSSSIRMRILSSVCDINMLDTFAKPYQLNLNLLLYHLSPLDTNSIMKVIFSYSIPQDFFIFSRYYSHVWNWKAFKYFKKLRHLKHSLKVMKLF